MHNDQALSSKDTTVTSVDQTPLGRNFVQPPIGFTELLSRLGTVFFPHDPSIAQYIAWANDAGVFQALSRSDGGTVADVAARTDLTEAGADSLLGVLCAAQLVIRDVSATYELTETARCYFLADSAFYVGDQLNVSRRLPPAYSRRAAGMRARLELKWLSLIPSYRFGSKPRLRNQHARNLSAGAAAVRTGEFKDVRHMVDLAGGSGSFAIPLALEHAGTQITLVELPEALPNIRPFLTAHNLSAAVQLLGMNALKFPWSIPQCDGIFVGNFLHGFSDYTCHKVCMEAFRHLKVGGRLWIHEIVWNERKDGPMVTALLHAGMRSGGQGRQRTVLELQDILTQAGFSNVYVVPTSGAYCLIVGVKREKAIAPHPVISRTTSTRSSPVTAGTPPGRSPD